MKYIHDSKIKNMPDKWRFSDGRSTGNFSLLDVLIHVSEGWLPITTINNESYNPKTQTRSSPVITTYGDHAQLDYTVTDKTLVDVRKAKRQEIKPQGRALIHAKYDQDARERVFAGADPNTGYNADLSLIRTHWADVILPAILAATTVAEIDVINTGIGSGLEWPVI